MPEEFSDWIGRSESHSDALDPWPARAAAAMLDCENLDPGAGAELPPLWHWLYFLATVPQSGLATDGHPQRGGFMPPIELPRRMFAGSRMTFHRPLRLGRTAERLATIRDVRQKSGRSGQLAFVTVDYSFRQDGELCIEEQQDIVYREAGAPVAAPEVVEPPELPAGTWSREVNADSRLLFRFSALTFNAHRIHYDRAYAREEEGYPGLIVHGPLTAMLLADLVRRNDARRITQFSFRGAAPLFDLAPLRLRGNPAGESVALEARGPDERPALAATAVLKQGD
ncbi:MAG: MaoC family dehydratase N-terminal domain-containing protein [Wenzhouxiangella sp.]|jgi:3-methylfumaryl-CoA hydratase|nr:MaoC family dehydratase N-terminal domain-containing protein [Wenzhouxiangella sp.]